MDWGQDGKAFRAQLVVPEQRQLYDYWLAKAGAETMPRRTDIRPTDIPRLLPGLSLVEGAVELRQCRVRLAGTRLRDIYDREITGLRLAEMDWADKRDYWMTAYERTLRDGLPTQGVVRGPRVDKEHLVQYWLRLPLRMNDTSAGMVLCYDHFMSASDRVDELMSVSA